MTSFLAENDFRKAVPHALRQVRQSGVDSALAHTRLALDTRKRTHLNSRRAAQEVLAQGVVGLEEGDRTKAELLRLRYFDGRSINSLTAQLSRSEATLYRDQRQAVQSLTDLLWSMETDARQRHLIRQYGRLEPPTYNRLFGVEDFLARLQVEVQRPGAPWLILLQGVGGLGKTALADASLRRNVGQGWYDEIAWVSARQKSFQLHGRIVATDTPTLSHEALVEALAQQVLADTPLPGPFFVDKALPLLVSRLQNAPHLLVVDNLETVVDVAALLPTLRRLVNPSKVILTSRVHLSSESAILALTVPQLSASAACELVRAEGELRNAPWLVEADDDALAPIYETVGGNPLALRLVAGQAIVHALPTVLGNLRAARGRSAEQLYIFIYRGAWNDLDEKAQRTLLALPLAPPSGASLEHLVQMSGLSEEAVHNALEDLVRRSLVDVRGDLYRRRYTIHSLTRTFLLEQVAKWR
jgi:hypothetical protein